ncbi:MAG: outer membrane beta-barrel protein [Steroidobacter sp.]
MADGIVGIRGAIIALVGLSGVALIHGAEAAELGFYVAGHYGNATMKAADKALFDDFATFVYSQFGFTPEQTSSTLGDDTDSSFGMAAGYRLLPNLAFEAGYVDLGEIGYRNDSFGTHIDHQEPWFQKISVSTSGIALSALGVLPLSYRWELYARGGVLFATNETNIYITDFFGAETFRLSDSNTEWLAGVGTSFSFAEVYAARFEYQRVFDTGSELAQGDIDVLSIGFTVAF